MTSGPEITPQDAQDCLDGLTEIVALAAAATLATSFSTVALRIKTDLTPVTAADELSESIILEGLSKLLPGVPVVAEESVGRMRPTNLEPTFIVVDPLDAAPVTETELAEPARGAPKVSDAVVLAATACVAVERFTVVPLTLEITVPGVMP